MDSGFAILNIVFCVLFSKKKEQYAYDGSVCGYLVKLGALFNLDGCNIQMNDYMKR